METLYNDLLRDTLNKDNRLYYDLLGYTLLNTDNKKVLSCEQNLFLLFVRRDERLKRMNNKGIHLLNIIIMCDDLKV